MPTISLIIPIYNTEKWLRRCLDSVLAQTYQDYELILVDDGSRDSSAAILDEYASRDGRFHVFREQNRGSSLARKFGMSKAQGEWFIFMDSDDDVHPTYIQALYDAATQNNLLIAACDMQRVANDAEPKIICNATTAVLTEDALHDRFFKYDFWGLGGKIYHKSVFSDLYFPQYNINEDYVVMAQIFHHHPSMAYVPQALYYYRINPESQSHLRLTPRIMDEYHNKRWVLDFYQQNAPKYVPRAKAQLTETCIKLLNIISNEDTEGRYTHDRQTLKSFLRHNILFIIFRSNMLMGLKVASIIKAI